MIAQESLIIEQLRDDSNYYGKYGQRFLSNSDIGSLLRDPRMFRRYNDPTISMLMGSYLHTKILEPEKLDNFMIVDSSTRTTKVYKMALESSGASMLLLQKEKDDLDFLCDCVTMNMTFWAIACASRTGRRGNGGSSTTPAPGRCGRSMPRAMMCAPSMMSWDG